MNKMKQKLTIQKPEIMAPAGNWTSLQAALGAGCDAVYFGVEGSNMRTSAKNFTAEDLPKITQICHERGAKAYLAANTIIYEKELGGIAELMAASKAAGVDAIICWDFAVVRAASKENLPIFISTQMSVSNSESILYFYENLGIKRYVLARECTLKDIQTMKKNLKDALGSKAQEIELEIFIHGAMCIAISGRCQMTQFQHGKSANRGECVQTCRREYRVTGKDGQDDLVVGEGYVMSPKDLCAIPFIEQLIEADVSSFKIEGRSRSPEYVATVVSAYRRAVDFYFDHYGNDNFEEEFSKLKTELTTEVGKVYNRGFASGYYMGKPVDDWTNNYGSVATTKKEFVGVVTNYYKEASVAEVDLQSGEFHAGDEVIFQGETTGVVSQVAESIEVDHSKVDRVKKGMLIAIKTDKLVRRNDKLYVVRQETRDKRQETGDRRQEASLRPR